MNSCICCGSIINSTISWGTWLTHLKRKVVCRLCYSKIEKITGKRCSICSRRSELSMCNDCYQWQQLGEIIQYNHSIYHYNDWLKEIISLWKYRGDYLLREVFREDFKASFEITFSSVKNEIIAVPIPLSDTRMKERGFNQALALAEILEIPISLALHRNVGEKQSKKSRKERVATSNPFYMEHPISKKVVLIDDIYTTGTTIRQAASVLMMNGCPEVYAFTLIRG